LTGEENKDMLNAHINSAFHVGDPFKHKGEFYDFGNQIMSKKVEEDMKIMIW